MALKNIKDIISSKAEELSKIINTPTEEYRKELDSKIHILDLSKNTLKINMRGEYESEVFDKLYIILQEVVIKAMGNRITSDLDTTEAETFISTLNTKGRFLVYNGETFYLVGNSFGALRTFVTEKISKSKSLVNTRFGQNTITTQKIEKVYGKERLVERTERRSNLDIGHISTENNPNLQSPLESKLQNIYQEAGIIPGPVGIKIAERTKAALNKLYSIQAKYQYSFKNTAPEAIALAREKLATGYIIVTIQTSSKNNAFARIEGRIMARLKREIAIILSKAPSDFSGSNTVLEDLVLGLAGLYDKTLIKKLKIHPEQKGSGTLISSKPSNTAIRTSVPSIQLRTTKGQFYSLTSLQSLLNSSLHNRIKANMGTGDSRNILNYRTGRFAESAKVEKVTESRAGMITAFYTYMKNPYATFSEGGRQSSPRTRDPKLLISKSIREIAATKVANRLRAVSL